jgi:hypothetical protein
MSMSKLVALQMASPFLGRQLYALGPMECRQLVSLQRNFDAAAIIATAYSLGSSDGIWGNLAPPQNMGGDVGSRHSQAAAAIAAAAGSTSSSSGHSSASTAAWLEWIGPLHEQVILGGNMPFFEAWYRHCRPRSLHLSEVQDTDIFLQLMTGCSFSAGGTVASQGVAAGGSKGPGTVGHMSAKARQLVFKKLRTLYVDDHRVRLRVASVLRLDDIARQSARVLDLHCLSVLE